MAVTEGLRKWASLLVGFLPEGDTMSSSLSSVMATSGFSSIVLSVKVMEAISMASFRLEV